MKDHPIEILHRTKIVEMYLVQKEASYPLTPMWDREIYDVPEFVLDDGRIFSGEYTSQGRLIFRES